MAAPLLPVHAADAVVPADDGALRVAIITENFLPKIDGSTVTLAHLLQHMKRTGVQAMLFGPESGMTEYAGCRLFGTFGVPLRVYPGLKINFISPAFLRALRAFAPDVIHIVDPIWLGVQALAAIALLFPRTPLVTSHHTNLPTYAAVFGYPYHTHRTWALHAYLHSFARCTLVPSASTANLLRERGWRNLRVCERGVDGDFRPDLRSEKLREAWGVLPSDVVILSVGRLSPEKNLVLLVDAFARLLALLSRPRAAANESASENEGEREPRAHLVFVGDGPFAPELRRLCAVRGVSAIFTGQLTGRALGEAFASADVMCAPSITETFGQVTLQGMASGLPVVGLYVEGTADLVLHGETGYLLDVHEAAKAQDDFVGFGDASAASTSTSTSTSGKEPSAESCKSPTSASEIWAPWAWAATAVGYADSAAAAAYPDSVVGDDAECPPLVRDDDAPWSPADRAPATPPDALGRAPTAAEWVPTSKLDVPALDAPSEEYTEVGGDDETAPLIAPGVPGYSALAPAPSSLSPLTTAPTPMPSQTETASQTPANAWTPDSPLAPTARIAAYADCAPLVRAPAVAARFAALLHVLVVDPDRRRAMGVRARERAGGYEWDGALGRMLGAYGEAVGGDLGLGTSALSALPSAGGSGEEVRAGSALVLSRDVLTKHRPNRAGEAGNGKAWWGVQPVVDAAVVVHALVAATLSHAAYMVPTARDLWG